MTRRRAMLAAVVAAAALLLPAQAHAAGVTLTPQPGTEFPDRTFVLTLPTGAPLTASEVHVTENGQGVDNLELARLTNVDQTGVVLVIDASNSMHGDSIANAFEAARQFAAQRNPEQPLSVIVFNNDARVLLPFTTDQAQIDAALATEPTLGEGTHILDATSVALGEIRKAGMQSGSVVVLSDGADTGSTATAGQVAAAARSQHSRVYTVGLESGSFQPELLQQLADGSAGSYTGTTSTDQLAGIYHQLGAALANQYVIGYRSLQPAASDVAVAVSVDGQAQPATYSYQTPSLSTTPGSGESESRWQTFIHSWLGAVLVAAFGGCLIAYAVITIFQPRRRGMRERVGGFVPEAPHVESDGPAITAALYQGTERALGGTSWWTRFSEDVEISGMSMTPAQAVVGSLTLGVLFASLLVLAFNSAILLLMIPLIPIVSRIVISQRADKRRFEFATQLPDNLQVLASALRAGHSMVGAMSVMAEDAPEPSRTEFRRVVAEERIGVPLDESLRRVGERMNSREVMQIALVSVVQAQTGGNTAEILDQVSTNIRARFDLKRLVRTLTAQGRVSRWIVTALPVGLFLLVLLINPGYLQPLLHTTTGHILLAATVVMNLVGSWTIGRIVQVEV